MSNALLLRKRLIDAISEGENQVTYIYGPAGFGKTTLARQWAQMQQRTVIWFNGYATSQPENLLEDFISATVSAVPGISSKFENFRIKDHTPDVAISKIFKTISEYKSQFIFIIENAELIRQNHNDLSRLFVSAIPTNVTMLLLTRNVPRSEFLQSVGSQKFNLIGPDQLKFTKSEILILAKELRSEVSEEYADEILEFTEGWPAGVDIIVTQSDSIGTKEKIFDFLKLGGKESFKIASKKILANLSSDELEILMKLSLFQEINSDIALYATEHNEVVRILTLLSQNSIIVNQIQSTPPIFKLHPIIKETLLDELLTMKDSNLHIEKAIRSLIENEDIRQAVHILIELGDTHRLREVLNDPKLRSTISKNIYEAIMNAEIPKLRSWISVSQYAYGIGQAFDRFINIYCDILLGKFSAGEAQIKLLKSELTQAPKEMKDQFWGDVLALECIINFAQGNLKAVVSGAKDAFDFISKAATDEHHQVTYIQLATLAAVIRDNDQELREISRILDSEFFQMGTRSRGLNLLAIRSVIAAYEGRFTEAQNNLSDESARANSSKSKGFFADHATQIIYSMILLEQGKLTESVKVLKESAQKSIAAFNYPLAITALGRLSYHLHLLGNEEEALEALGQGRELISENKLSDELNDALDIWELRLRYHLRDSERTNQLLKRGSGTYQYRAFEASVLLNTSPTKAMDILDTFDRSIPKQALTFHLHRAHIFHDSPALQLEETRKAVEIGAKHGYFNHFLTQRSDVIQQYISLAAESPTVFHERLARAAGERINEMMNTANKGSDALTRREADILRHLASGLPLGQMAKNLSISKNTLKTHLRHLYRKLGAKDRNDAVSKGRKLLKI